MMKPAAVTQMMATQARRSRSKPPRQPDEAEALALAYLRATRKNALTPIRMALAQRDKTQKWLVGELSQQAHIKLSQQAISNYLNGYAPIARDTLVWICGITGASMQEILSRVSSDESNLIQGSHRKNHCKQGHPFSVENTLIEKRGKRVCRTCHQRRQRERYLRDKKKRVASA